jgi:hypothetical protein
VLPATATEDVFRYQREVAAAAERLWSDPLEYGEKEDQLQDILNHLNRALLHFRSRRGIRPT